MTKTNPNPCDRANVHLVWHAGAAVTKAGICDITGNTKWCEGAKAELV